MQSDYKQWQFSTSVKRWHKHLSIDIEKQIIMESRFVCKISGNHCNTQESQVHVYVFQFVIP